MDCPCPRKPLNQIPVYNTLYKYIVYVSVALALAHAHARTHTHTHIHAQTFTSPGKWYPAQVRRLDDVPLSLHREFSRISDRHIIVEWVTENNFSPVLKSRTFPLGRTNLDQSHATKSEEVMHRYMLALDLL